MSVGSGTSVWPTVSRWAAKAAASASCNAPASTCRRASSCARRRLRISSARCEREAPVRSRVASLAADDLDGVGVASRELRARFEAAPLPAGLEQEIRDAYESLGEAGRTPVVAVRSSATTEDGADASFAGLQDTYLWRTQPETCAQGPQLLGEPVLGRVGELPARQAIPESAVAMAVVVQPMVDARTAGVMFTRSPITGDDRSSRSRPPGDWGPRSSAAR